MAYYRTRICDRLDISYDGYQKRRPFRADEVRVIAQFLAPSWTPLGAYEDMTARALRKALTERYGPTYMTPEETDRFRSTVLRRIQRAVERRSIEG